MTFREKIKELLTPGNGFKLSKPAKKFLYGLIFAMVMAAITYSINYIEGGSMSVTHAFLTGVGISMLRSAQNAIKHYKDDIDKELEK